MDLNELLFQHQIALIRSAEAPARCVCSAFDLVRHYETRIARHRRELGVAAYPRWSSEPCPGAA